MILQWFQVSALTASSINHYTWWTDIKKFFHRRVRRERREKLYLVAENLVLWARSELIGYAVNLLQAGAE